MILREGKQGARAVGLDDWQQHTLIAMFQYYELYGFGGNPRVLQGVLGRKPTTFVECMERMWRERGPHSESPI